MAILYRTNNAFNPSQRCPKCNKTFDRGHLIDPCSITMDILRGDDMVTDAYFEHLLVGMPDSYNLLDAALNSKQWKIADEALWALQLILNCQYGTEKKILQQELRLKYSK